jgi:hypothetical protein
MPLHSNTRDGASIPGVINGGEGGIRTRGGSHLSGFQDRRNRPLCHLSDIDSTAPILTRAAGADLDDLPGFLIHWQPIAGEMAEWLKARAC